MMLIDGEEWDTEGLPAHMLRGVPLRAQVEVEYRLLHHDLSDDIMMRVSKSGKPFLVFEEPLERDGKPLTLADRKGWLPGEAEGWRPTKLVHASGGSEIIDID